MTNRETFFDKISATTGSDHTTANYKTALNHFDDYLEQKDLEESDLDTDDIYGLEEFFTEKELAGSTIDQYLGCVEKYIRDEISEEVADQINNFVFDTQSLTEEKTSTKTPILEKKDYVQLRHFADDTRSELIIQLLWETGIRPLELTKIKIDDIDREEQLIEIETAKIPPKSNRQRTRTVPYSIEMRPTLRDWLDYGDRARYKTASRSDYLIVTENATQMSSNYVNTLVLQVADKADLKYAYKETDKETDEGTDEKTDEETDEESDEKSPKNQYFPNARHFRNSYATHRIWNGMDLETLRSMMGHHDVSVTAKYVKEKDQTLKEKNEHFRPKTSDMTTEVVRDL